MLDRTTPPAIRPMAHFSIARPERRVLRNDIRLNILQMGDEDVVRFDVLMRGGQWCQSQPLQSLFTNRMLREGCHGFSSSQIAERLDFYGAWLDLSSSFLSSNNCKALGVALTANIVEPIIPVIPIPTNSSGLCFLTPNNTLLNIPFLIIYIPSC